MNNKSGFSLTEMMVAVGIMGVMSLALVTEMERAQKDTKSVQLKLEQIDFVTALTNQIASGPSCVATFANVRITPAALATALATGTSIDLRSDQISVQGTKLTDQKFDSFSGINIRFNVTAVPSANTALGNLTVDLAPKTQFENYPRLKSPSISFGVTVDATGVITSCPAITSTTRFISSVGCQWIDVYIPECRSCAPRRFNCPAGNVLLFATGAAQGSQDGNDSYYFSTTATSVTVRARRDQWRVIGKCCPQN